MAISLLWYKLDLDVCDCYAVIELITLGCVVRLLLKNLPLAVLPSLWLQGKIFQITAIPKKKKDEGWVILPVKWILLMLDKKLARICCKAALILTTEQAHMQDYPARIENN